MKLKLRVVIPLILALLFTVLSIGILTQALDHAEQGVVRRESEKMRLLFTHMQDEVEESLKTKNMKKLWDSLAQISSDIDINLAYVIDHSENIVASLKRTDQGQNLHQLLLEAKLEKIGEQLHQGQGGILSQGRLLGVDYDPTDQMLYVQAQVNFGLKPGELRSLDYGWLTLVKDLSRLIDIEKARAYREYASFLILSLFLFLLLGLLMHYWLSRRLGLLIDFTQAYAQGDRDIQINMQGQDEISQLAQALAQMAEHRNQFEDELRSSHQSLQVAQEIAQLGSWSWDIIAKEHIWSDEMFYILGLDSNSVQADLDLMINAVLPQDMERMKLYRERILNDPAFQEPIEFKVSWPSGEHRQLLGQSRVDWFEGKAVKLHGYLQDITHLSEMETKLLESEKMLDQAQDIAHLGTWSWEVEQNDFQWSDEVFGILGYQPGLVSPSMETLLEHIIQEDQQRFQTQLSKIIENPDQQGQVEFAILRKDGKLRHIFTQGEMIQREGKANVMIGTFQDVTPFRNLEEDLHEQREKLEAILGNAPEMILTMDRKGEITYINHIGEAGSSEQFIGSSATNLMLPEYHLSFLSRLTIAWKEGESVKLEYRDRQEKIWQAQFLPLHLKGEVLQVMMIASEVTEIRNSMENLEIARQDAEAANLAKSEFLANMGHEIRTPLNAVLGFSELLGEQLQEPILKGYVDSIHVAGGNLLVLINDILDISKLDAGHLKIHPKLIEQRHLWEEVANIYAEVLEQKNLTYQLQLDEKLPPQIELDEERIRQILTNLMSNAIKFTEVGGIRLKVYGQMMEEGLELIFEIIDTGMGIALDQQERVFDSFLQLSKHEIKKEKGTGLGLSICRRLVELMGGSLEVESKLGEGSCFRVRLPKLKYQMEEAALDQALQVGKGSLLVVDDMMENRALIRESLRRKGVQVEEASGGAEAVKKALELQPSLILMDLRMPGMDGFEAARLIKQDPRGADLPILAFTASYPASKLQGEEGKYFNGYVPKPINLKELYEKVKQFILSENEAPKPAQTPKVNWRDCLLEVQNPTDLFTLYDQELAPEVEELKSLIDLERAEALAQRLTLLAGNHHCDYLKLLGERLSQASLACEIQTILDLLNELNLFMNALKEGS